MIFRPVRRDFSIFLLVFPIIISGVKSDFNHLPTVIEADEKGDFNIDTYLPTVSDADEKDDFNPDTYLATVSDADENDDFNPDTYLPTNKIIERRGYTSETHDVTTKDGYILTMHRIPNGNGQRTLRSANELPQSPSGPCPVYFQHGVLSSSSDWIIHETNKSLAYRLADKGYDVWLGNIRGNTYSRSHIRLSPNKYPFWDFSFNEMAVDDVPTMIDYILEKTGHTQLYYIGHSMGTTMFWVLCSSKPEYNSKIKTMFSLAPVAFMSNAKTPLRFFARFSKSMGLFSKWFGHGEFLRRSPFLDFIMKISCGLNNIEKRICKNSLFLICGFDSQQFDMALLPVILAHTPAGGSSKTLQHYAQLIRSAKFRKFDYGWIGNMRQYHSFTPPEYNLSLITAPVSLHYSDNDYLANVKDVKQLTKSLPNLIGAFRVDYRKFNHIDFLWSRDINSLLNDRILKQIDSIEKGVIPYNKTTLDEIPDLEENFDPVFNNDISPLLKFDEKDKKGKGPLNSIMDLKRIKNKKLNHLKLKKQAQYKNSKHMKDLSINAIGYEDKMFNGDKLKFQKIKFNLK